MDHLLRTDLMAILQSSLKSASVKLVTKSNNFWPFCPSSKLLRGQDDNADVLSDIDLYDACLSPIVVLFVESLRTKKDKSLKAFYAS